MSRRNSRRHQQAMNEYRRTGRWMRLAEMGIPIPLGPGAMYFPSDPELDRAEFVRQITARVPLEPGQPPPMSGEVGRYEGFRIITE